MVQQPQVETTRSIWTDPDLLADLLDYFRAQGFKISTEHYAIAQDLVLALIAQGHDIATTDALKTHLAPVVCTTPKEQNNFSTHFDRWCELHLQGGSARRSDRSFAERELQTTAARWIKWRWILAGLSILATTLVARLTWHYFHSYVLQLLPSTADVTTQVLGKRAPAAASLGLFGYLGLLIVTTFVASGVWWYVSGRRFLRRRQSADTPDLVTISLDSQTEQNTDPGFLRSITRELRRRYAAPSEDLNLPLTIEQTIKNDSRFTPVFRSVLITPEYLILVDRRSFRDHMASYVREMIQQLHDGQINIEQYYFDSDLRSVTPFNKRERPITLRDLAAKCRGFRVMMFTDGVGLFNSVTGELEPWADLISGWSSVAIFTPKLRTFWGYQETMLSSRFFVAPASPQSMLAFARAAAGGRISAANSELEGSPYPHVVADRTNRWLEPDAPPSEVVSGLLDSVKSYLGQDGYFWLSAVAVYPEIHFNLSTYLGKNLKNGNGRSLFDDQTATALFRLPWMRHAYMPDWLRFRLVSDLSKEQNASIREVLNRLLLAVASGSAKAIRLEIARKHSTELAALARTVFKRLAGRAEGDSPLKDYVFASVMLGRSLDPLSVRIPRAWRRLLKRRREDAIAAAYIPRYQRITTRVVAVITWVIPVYFMILPYYIRWHKNFGLLLGPLLAVSIVAAMLGVAWLNKRLLIYSLVVPFFAWFCLLAGYVIFPLLRLRQLRFTNDELTIFSTGIELLVVTGFIWLVVSAQALAPRDSESDQKSVKWIQVMSAAIHLLIPVTITLLDRGPEDIQFFSIIFVYFGAASLVGFRESLWGIKLSSRPLACLGIATNLIVYVFLFGASNNISSPLTLAAFWLCVYIPSAILVWRKIRRGNIPVSELRDTGPVAA